MKNLIKNNFRRLLRNKWKILCATFLMMLAVTVYGTMSNVFAPLKTDLTDFSVRSNQEEFKISFSTDLFVEKLEKEMVKRELEPINQEALKKVERELVNSFAKEKELTLELNTSKRVLENRNKRASRFIFIKKTKQINRIELKNGKLPDKEREIALNPQALESLNKKIGENLKIEAYQYKIVGTFFRPDYIVLSNLAIPDNVAPQNNYLVLAGEADFELISEEEQRSYSGKIRSSVTETKKRSIVKDLKQDKTISFQEKSENPLIAGMQERINNNEGISIYFSGLILIISIVVLIWILRKECLSQLKNIGVFKAHGYRARELLLPFIIYPIIVGGIGSLLGYLLGYYLSNNLRASFINYFNLPYSVPKLPIFTMLYTVFCVFSLISVLSGIILISLVKRKTIDLFRQPENDRKVNRLIQLGTKIKCEKFIHHLVLAFGLRNWKQIVALILTTMMSTLLILVACLQFSMVNQTVKVNKNQINYKYAVSYFNPINSKSEIDGQKGYQLPINQIKSKTVRENSDTATLLLLDLKKENLLNLLDKNGNKLSLKINKNSVLISSFIAKIEHISAGDSIVIVIDGGSYKAKIAGIVDDLSQCVYGNIDSDVFSGLTNQKINLLYTNKKPKEVKTKYQVVSLDDYLENTLFMAEQLQAGSYSIGLIALIISFILISMVLSINIYENQKNIALLKLLGYRNKEVTKIILNSTVVTIIFSCFLMNLISPFLFDLMENQLIKIIGAPIKIQITVLMNIVSCSAILFIMYLVILIQKFKIRKIHMNELLFE